VVAHLGCFGVKDPFVFQDRLKEKEEELRRETGGRSAGLGHDTSPAMPINDALVAIRQGGGNRLTLASRPAVLGRQAFGYGVFCDSPRTICMRLSIHPASDFPAAGRDPVEPGTRRGVIRH